MDYMYAPWRSEYLTNKESGCVFCNISKNPQKDREYHVLYRDEDVFVVMNKYPYSPGHLMVIPHFHTDRLEKLDEKIWIRLSIVAKRCVKMLREEFNADGVNLGMNLGKGAGAGIAEHVHYHVLPRWIGDTNFITTVANSRVYSVDFEKIYERLKSRIDEYIC